MDSAFFAGHHLGVPQECDQRNASDDVADQGGKEEMHEIGAPAFGTACNKEEHFVRAGDDVGYSCRGVNVARLFKLTPVGPNAIIPRLFGA